MVEPLDTHPQWRKWLMKAAFALMILGSCLGSCSYLNDKAGLDDNHAIEEAAEDLIKEHLGVEVDLSAGPEELPCEINHD